MQPVAFCVVMGHHGAAAHAKRETKPFLLLAVPWQVDGVWDLAAWSEAFVDIEGDAKPAPRFETRFKMLWDDTAL